MKSSYTNCPTGNRRATAYDQQRHAAAYARFDDFEYNYDTIPMYSSRSRRPKDSIPRSHPPGFQDRMAGPPPVQRHASMQKQWPRVSSGQAALQLHTALVESKGFCQDFLSAFDKDIQMVKPFARQASLDSLWQDKIEADIYPCGSHPGHEGARLSPPPPGAVNFSTVTRKLKQALYQACNAKARPPTNSPSSMSQSQATGKITPENDASSLYRLSKKLKGMWQELNELIVGARKSHREMSDLINELDMLLRILEDKRSKWGKINGNGSLEGGQWRPGGEY
jgi:hypothetical protein